MKALACFLFLALSGAGLSEPAHAAERTLGRQGLIDLARSNRMLCNQWRARDGSCEDVGYLEMLGEQEVRQTYRFRLSMEPDLEVIVRETAQLDGDALCSVFSLDDIEISVLADGGPASQEQSLAITLLYRESLAEYEGKKACETYYKDSATGDLRTVVTVDGEMAPTLDNVYRLLGPEDRIHLRPVNSGQDPKRQDI
ncbi:MAG: hypothetical protein QE280_04660 [Caulobacter sp.]|nr:hypothetical protein [Caulobacter sp.]